MTSNPKHIFLALAPDPGFVCRGVTVRLMHSGAVRKQPDGIEVRNTPKSI